MGNCFSVSCSLDALLLRCWDCAAQRSLHVCQLENNISALQKARGELVAKRDDVKRRVSSEEGPEMEQTCEVQNWVVSVGNLVTQVDELLQASPQEVKKLCLGGCCSKNYKASYKFGVAVAEKLGAVEELKKKDFVKVVDKVPPKQVVQQNVGHTVGMKNMLDEAMGYLLDDDQVETLGIYGMGGVGKTTLLKQINNKFRSFSNDCFVSFVTVSKDYQVDKLQRDIWKSLGYSIEDVWKEKTCQEKAQAIFNVMSRKKFVLLLDDVWKPIKLAEDIGVPENRNGSKVVITTRTQDVCRKMGTAGTRKEIKIKPLEREEAWELFCKMIGEDTLSKHPDIPSLAQDVIKECAGLPIAIITIARAMAPKSTPQEWRLALQRLRESPSDVEDVETEVLYRLKFSYDNLPNKSIQSCFLYCCLFPEDFEIGKDELIDCWIYEEFCSNRDEGYDVIGTLVRACLILEAGEGWLKFRCVKLHDVIRDMALWITSECEEENEKFLVEAGRQLTEIVEIEKWKGKKRISFMENNIHKVKGAPTCPNLLTLFLNWNSDLKEFDGDFFRSMDALRVLNLSHTGEYGPVVRSQFLIAISKLTCLQYLNLSNSNIKELPQELKMLVKLKYLNIEVCKRLTMIPRQLICSLLSLQVLRMFECGFFLKRVKEASMLSNEFDLIEELKCLKDLNVLSMTVKEESNLESVAKVPILRRSIEALSIGHMDGLNSLDVSLESLVHMEQLKYLWIGKVNILEDIGGRLCSSTALFHSLQSVSIYRCEYLLDLTWLTLAPNLTSLDVTSCSNVREIISAKKLGEILDYGYLFAKLQHIDLRYLDRLESIYVNSLSFPSLQLIWVWECSKLKKLPLNSNSAKDCRLEIRGSKDWWNGLEWEDDTTKATFSSSFRFELPHLPK